MSEITLAQASKAIEAAIKKSEELNVKMDNAWLGSIDISQKKAKTARYFNMDTGEIGKLSQPGGSLYNIEHSNNGLITFPGGVVIKNGNGEIIGAIGVSGSTVEDDHAVAAAGAAAV